MDPRTSTGIDINEASESDEKNQEGSVSPANTNEVMSNESEHHKSEEQVSEVPFRKARVSVRARSEAPSVCDG